MQSIKDILDGFDSEYYARQAAGAHSFLRAYFGNTGEAFVVRGIEHVPKDGRVVYVANHRSHLDYIIIPWLLHKN